MSRTDQNVTLVYKRFRANPREEINYWVFKSKRKTEFFDLPLWQVLYGGATVFFSMWSLTLVVAYEDILPLLIVFGLFTLPILVIRLGIWWINRTDPSKNLVRMVRPSRVVARTLTLRHPANYLNGRHVDQRPLEDRKRIT